MNLKIEISGYYEIKIRFENNKTDLNFN